MQKKRSQSGGWLLNGGCSLWGAVSSGAMGGGGGGGNGQRPLLG